MKIRPFKPSDAEVCFLIRSENVIRFYRDDLNADDLWDAFSGFLPRDYLREAEERAIFVAEEKGEVVGFYSIERDHKDGKGHIKFMHVRSDFHRQGIGTQFFEHSVLWLKANYPEVSVLKLQTSNPSHALPFYQKIGFKKVGEGSYNYVDRGVRMVELEKNL